MTKWKPMKLADLHKGALGYVEFNLKDCCCILILCEVVDINRVIGRIEIVPVAGDKSCLWVDSDRIYSKSW